MESEGFVPANRQTQLKEFERLRYCARALGARTPGAYMLTARSASTPRLRTHTGIRR
jgi:hypothetical protein